MKKEVIIKENIVFVACGNEFAIFERHDNSKGLRSITFSIPVKPQMTDLIDKSGVADVQKYSASGTMVIRPKTFYENYKMAELIADILEKSHPTL